MKIVGLQKISTIDYPGDVKKKLEIFSLLVVGCWLLVSSIKNHGVFDTHNFSWTLGGEVLI